MPEPYYVITIAVDLIKYVASSLQVLHAIRVSTWVRIDNNGIQLYYRYVVLGQGGNVSHIRLILSKISVI